MTLDGLSFSLILGVVLNKMGGILRGLKFALFVKIFKI
jgi:hypothetical protein